MSTRETHVIRSMDLYRGLHVVQHGASDTDPWGVIVAILQDPEDNAMISGPMVTVRWWLGEDAPVPHVLADTRAGNLLRVHRRLHENGHPDYCAEDCMGAHYGDHIEPGACCERCGGNKVSCALISGYDDGCGEGYGPEV